MSRSRWKFNYLGQDFLSQLSTTENAIIVQDRATIITSDMLGTLVRVYNGIKFFNILVENDKIGYRLGEFAPSKKKAARKKKVKVKMKKK